MVELAVNLVAKLRLCLYIVCGVCLHSACVPEQSRQDGGVANLAIVATTVVISSAIIIGSVVAYRRFGKLCDRAELVAARLQRRCYRFISDTEQWSGNWHGWS